MTRAHRSRLAPLALVLIIAGTGMPLHAQHRLTTTPAESANRLDPAVRASLGSTGRANVIILGRTQLLAPVGGLESFAIKHARSDRRVLRAQILTDLKQIAAREQPAITAVLGDRPMTRLWLINAVAATVTASEVARLVALDEVRFIYPAPPQRVASAADTGRVRAVLQPSVRPPFDLTGKRVPWNLRLLGAPQAWQEGRTTGEGVIVASLDNGVNYLHPDLTHNIWINPGEIPQNGLDDDGNGYVDDLYGFDFATMEAEVGAFVAGPGPPEHGTVTSGIVAGDGTKGIVTGVAPRAQIMILKGNGLVAAPLAFQYALENGADIMSMSFSIPDLGHARGLWRMLSDHAVAAGLVLAGGAGNFRQNQPIPVQHQSPKDVPSVIAVGGVDSLLALVSFSSMGPVEWSSVELYRDYPMPAGYLKPDVVAFPGPDYPILAYPDGYLDPNTRIRGNSLSGPQAAGVAALMLSVHPGLPAWRVLEILRATARDLGAPGPDPEFGAGLIDAAAAVRMAQREKAANQN